MKYYIKCSLFAFTYLVAMDIGALLISYISTIALRVALSYFWVAFYCLIIGVMFFKEGETALDFRHANDLQRKHMVETGNIVEIKTAPEYKPYKGFMIGIYACIPLLIALTVHLIVGLAAGANGAGIVGSIVYFTFYMLYGSFQTGVVMTFGEYFIILYTLVIMSFTTGISYLMGAKKAQKKYDLIEQKQREIYGDGK